MIGRVQMSASPLRCAAWLAAGSLAVHELRYALAFGSDAEQRLGETGHGYLTLLTPGVTVALAIAAGLAIVRPGGDPARSWRRTWLLVSMALLAIYVGQELAEGWLAAGHEDGLVGVFGDGGWLALPSALALGALATAGLHGRAAVRRLLAAGSVPAVRLSVPRVRVSFFVVPRLPVMAASAAGRAPPLGP